MLGVAEHDVDSMDPIVKTEREILGAVEALRGATESIEHHVEVIDVLATSVGPLTQSVNQLNTTMVELVKVLGPLASAERGVEDVEGFFGRHLHRHPPGPDPGRQ